MWQAQIFTLYPDIFPGPFSKGLYGKALSNKLWDLKVVNIRDAAEDKHKTVTKQNELLMEMLSKLIRGKNE